MRTYPQTIKYIHSSILAQIAWCIGSGSNLLTVLTFLLGSIDRILYTHYSNTYVNENGARIQRARWRTNQRKKTTILVLLFYLAHREPAAANRSHSHYKRSAGFQTNIHYYATWCRIRDRIIQFPSVVNVSTSSRSIIWFTVYYGSLCG